MKKFILFMSLCMVSLPQLLIGMNTGTRPVNQFVQEVMRYCCSNGFKYGDGGVIFLLKPGSEASKKAALEDQNIFGFDKSVRDKKVQETLIRFFVDLINKKDIAADEKAKIIDILQTTDIFGTDHLTKDILKAVCYETVDRYPEEVTKAVSLNMDYVAALTNYVQSYKPATKPATKPAMWSSKRVIIAGIATISVVCVAYALYRAWYPSADDKDADQETDTNAAEQQA